MRKKVPDFTPDYQKEFQTTYTNKPQPVPIQHKPIAKLLMPYTMPLQEMLFTLEAKINEIIDRING